MNEQDALEPARDSVPSWAPWAVLGGLLSLGLLGGLGVVPLPGLSAPARANRANTGML